MKQDRDFAATELRLDDLLARAGLPSLDPQTIERFGEYLALLMRWNARMNLTAVRDSNGIVSRHFVESIACAQYLPSDIDTLLDLGSGAGFPGIPIAICRPEIKVTLAESQSKKAAFLQEIVRTLRLNSRVFAQRAENLSQEFDCVTLRAVDRMDQAILVALDLLKAEGWLAILTTSTELSSVKEIAGGQFVWAEPKLLPVSEQRILALGSRSLS